MILNLRYLFAILIFSISSSFSLAASTSVSVGSEHSCAIVNGGLQCWGNNTTGQLGTGSTTASTIPVQVLGLTSGVTQVSAGKNHTCAIVNSQVWCWGSNSNSKLGDSSAILGNFSYIPRSIPGLSGASLIKVGDDLSCAVVNGAAKCWGKNPYPDQHIVTDQPTVVPGLESGVNQISIGKTHACAVVHGSVKCWGANDKGQLGDSTITNSSVPVNVSRYSSGFSAISANFSKHTCAVMNGSVQCWGDNTQGELGNGVTEQSRSPVAATGLSSGATAVSTTSASSCAIVNGNVFCWGSNGGGRLGNNSSAPSLIPVQTVSFNGRAQAISSGDLRTCAITTDDKLYCWGPFVGSIPTEILFSSASPTQSQTITFTSPGASKTFVAGTTFQISASSSSNLPISFTTNANGHNCTVTGSTVTMVRQGSCVITATQSGDSTFLPAQPVSQTVELTPKVYQNQTVSFQGELSQSVPVGGVLVVAATSTSGLPVTLSSLSPAVCSVNNNRVTVVAEGRCELYGEQGGNDTYASSYSYFNVWIGISDTRSSQTISMNLGGPQTASIGDTFSISATASSGLTVDLGASPIQVCRLAGSVITVMGAGVCNIHAYQGGNAIYKPVTADGTIQISINTKQPQTITFSNLPSVTMMAGDQFLISANSSSGLPVVVTNLTPTVCLISNLTVTVIKEGVCAYRATQSGNETYSAVTADGGTNIILVQGQTINFNYPPTVSLPAGQRFVVSATASSGLAVAISSVSPAVCAVSGTTVTVISSGACQLQAVQSGTTTIRPVTVSGTVNISVNETQTMPVISLTNNGSAEPGTSMVLNVVNAAYGDNFYVMYRRVDQNWSNERSFPMYGSSFSFDMPESTDLFVAVRRAFDQNFTLLSTEFRLKSTTATALAPKINSVEIIGYPAVNGRIIFKINGENLYSGLGFSVNDCEPSNGELSGWTSNSVQFGCTPRGIPGEKNMIVKNMPGGELIFAKKIQIQSTLTECRPVIRGGGTEVYVPYMKNFTQGGKYVTTHAYEVITKNDGSMILREKSQSNVQQPIPRHCVVPTSVNGKSIYFQEIDLDGNIYSAYLRMKNGLMTLMFADRVK